MKKIEKIINRIIFIIFTSIIFVLTLLSIFNNTHVNVYEQITIKKDNPIFLIFCFMFCIIIIYIFTKNNIIGKFFTKRNCILLAVIFLSICFLFIIKYPIEPLYDQQYVLQAASSLRDGNYSMFKPDGYIGIYPHQSGIVIIFYFLSFIFGKNNYQAIQILNALFLLISYFFIFKISEYIFKEGQSKYFTLLFSILFIPLIFYINFVYGNIFGLSFSLIAVYNALLYFDKRKLLNMFFSLFASLISMMFKSNYSITLIAIIIYTVYDCIFRKKYFSSLFFLGCIIIYLMSSFLPNYLIKEITHINLGNGIPKIAWIEMGLQDNTGSPGWYNDYSRQTYINNNYDYNDTTKQVKKDLITTLKNFSNDPKYLINFLYRKTVSQWCDPEFQGPWILRFTNYYFESKFLYNLLNVLESIIFLYYNDRTIDSFQLFLAIIFIGGFVFHIFWEAKCQYTITYFILLVPYCARGFINIVDEINNTNVIANTKESVYDKILAYVNTKLFKFIMFLILVVGIVNVWNYL